MGDKRLTKRCNKLIKQFVISPASSIPQACGSWKDTKAAYRFFSHDDIDPETIFRAHYKQTIARIKKEDDIILAPQDTTSLNYSTHKKTQGLGRIGMDYLSGILIHSCLAVTVTGVPLGLLYQKRWARPFSHRKYHNSYELPIEEKESLRWITAIQTVEQSIPRDKTVVVIGDRESDIYALFTQPRQKNIHLLVRASSNRGVVSDQRMLFPTMKELPSCGALIIQLNKTPTRKPRRATLTVKYTPITLKSPDWGKGRAKGRIDLFCIQATEKNPPKGEQPVSWILLTTVPVISYEDAVRVINWYSRRWLIERFHYCLKSGCNIEELQLQDRKRIERALAIYCIVAWQLLWLTYEAREHPAYSCTRIFSTDEWQALVSMVKHTKKKSREPPTMQEVIHLIASLGGFLGRKSDHDPGVKTLWIGLRRFSDIIATWRYLGGIKKDVGKG